MPRQQETACSAQQVPPVHGTVGTPEAVGVWSLLGKAYSLLRWVIMSTVKIPQNIRQLRKKGQDSA